MTEYYYYGHRLSEQQLKGRHCVAVLNNDGKCIRGKNGNMLVDFGERKVVVLASS